MAPERIADLAERLHKRQYSQRDLADVVYLLDQLAIIMAFAQQPYEEECPCRPAFINSQSVN